MTLKFWSSDAGTVKNAVFCFTGKAPKTRNEMEAIAISAEAQVTSSVNGKTTILVIADANSMSCKAKSARDRDIDLISPEQFFEMCGDVIQPKKQFAIQKPTNKLFENKRHSSVRRIQL